jgi:8-amino-7-oxononanoate synthase
MTFGKAIGSHGAAIVGSKLLRNFLINFSRPFIYTTALPLHNILAIKSAYSFLPSLKAERKQVQLLSTMLNQQLQKLSGESNIPSPGPINLLYAPGISQLKAISEKLQQHNFDVRPVFSPTVPVGKERLRIIVHAYNTTEQLDELVNLVTPYSA